MPFRQRASSRPVTSRRSPATRQTAERRTVGHSRTITSDLVLFSDLNNYGSIFGGRLVSIIDKTAAISAQTIQEEARVPLMRLHDRPDLPRHKLVVAKALTF